MNWGYMGDLMLRVAIVTPAAILFGVLLLVGLLMLLERSGAFAAMQREAMVPAGADLANPAAGGIVAGLKDAVEAEATGSDAEETKTGTEG